MYIEKETLELIDNLNLNNKEVKEFIERAKKEITQKDYKRLDDYFKNDDGILAKNRILAESANNKILANYARYITTINVGYFMSEPIKYNVIDLPGEEENNINIEPIINTYKENTILETDKQNAMKLSKYGKCYELIYINENTEIKSKSINPYNAGVFKIDNLEETEELGIYIIEKKKSNLIYLYTKQNEIVAEEKDGNLKVISNKNNLLKEIPIIEYKNNEEEIGDYETVISLIDGYNKIESNDVDNVEEFIDSILLVAGDTANLTYEQAKVLRESRALNVGDGTASYLTKTLDETGLTMALKRLSQDIHKFSFTPDMSDENFAGTQSGVALEYKLLPFELHMKSKQAQYTKAVKKRFYIYNVFLNILKNAPIVDLNVINVEFTRGLPKNDIEVANMITRLQGIVTDKTLISRLSFVQDPDAEIESLEMQKEKSEDRQIKKMIMAGNYTNLGNEEKETHDHGKVEEETKETEETNQEEKADTKKQKKKNKKNKKEIEEEKAKEEKKK
jgi:SPP1 family phage portal protein